MSKHWTVLVEIWFCESAQHKYQWKSGMAIKDNGEKTLSAKRLKMHVSNAIIHPDLNGWLTLQFIFNFSI